MTIWSFSAKSSHTVRNNQGALLQLPLVRIWFSFLSHVVGRSFTIKDFVDM